jgi:dipeptidyl-peptidase-3
VYKRPDETIVIKVCSINQKTEVHAFKKRRFEIEYGFMGSFLRRVVENLLKAHEKASNITQKKMIDAYIAHFRTGDIELHKESQRQWVKDIGPIVETNLGFI